MKPIKPIKKNQTTKPHQFLKPLGVKEILTPSKLNKISGAACKTIAVESYYGIRSK